ncbi:VWA domain-containing protein [Halomonas sp. NCCP-2165]|nr:VWA domain-containing protein [Halomonas sp. NCCP-2165]GKW50444.1 hypothetical protein NCCP2165_26590 [Halomonas sp. NCCP-2165]
MQRLLRDEGYALVDPELPRRQQALIHRHCPPSIGNLFALPRKGRDGGLEWWSELPGQPCPVTALSAAEQARLMERLSQRLAALGSLIDELERRGDPAAQALRDLPTQAAEANLYSVGGDPVVIRWASLREIATPPPAAHQATPTAPPPPQAPAQRRRWLLVPVMLPVLLVGMALLGVWLALHHWGPISLPWPSRADEVMPMACRGDDAPPPQFVTIFDTSGSMNLHIGASLEDERWFFDMSDRQRERYAKTPRVRQLFAGPSRLEIAKPAFAELVRAIDPEIDIGLVTYRGCMAPRVHGTFAADERPRLMQGVNELIANDGTPLGDSLRRAAQLVDGQERDAVILAFVDGADGCGRDQCAIAQEIARQQPRLRINVMDISNSGQSDCIAEATGGRVFGSQDADAVSDMLKDAGREALNASHCPG